jgi:Spx/MgsR family transcriptional regulator
MVATVYGIKNCDTVKKARAWLDSRGIEYVFHDFKTAGVGRRQLEHWCATLGWAVLLNRAGTTFRKLPEQDKQVNDAKTAIKLMLAQPSMIKRPVLDHAGSLLVGFKPESYALALGARAATR